MISDDPGDSGERIEVVDLVDGHRPDLVDALIDLHASAFPDYTFALDEIAVDARSPSQRDGIVVHQALFLVDDVPAGFILFDSNVVRRFSVVHFAAVGRHGRAVRVDGRRLSALMVTHALATSTADLDGNLHGLIGESPAGVVRLWTSIGLRRLPVDYAEPDHGRAWYEHLAGAAESSAPVSPIALMWLPPSGVPVTATHCDEPETPDEPAELAPAVLRAAVAAYLLDHYWLDDDHPLVRSLVGDEADRPRPTGRQPSRRRRFNRYDN